jgi:hypothetical protein
MEEVENREQSWTFPIPSFLLMASMHAFGFEASPSVLLIFFLAPCSFCCVFPLLHFVLHAGRKRRCRAVTSRVCMVM